MEQIKKILSTVMALDEATKHRAHNRRERDFEIEIAADDENPHFLGAIKNETS